MKTLPQINTLISELQTSIEQLPNATKAAPTLFEHTTKVIKPRERNKIKYRYEFLTTIRNYLETGPNEEYLKGEISRLKTLIANLSLTTVPRDFYPENFSGDAAAYFNKNMGIDGMRENIKCIEFILTD